MDYFRFTTWFVSAYLVTRISKYVFFVQKRVNDEKRAVLKVWKISFQTCFDLTCVLE